MSNKLTLNFFICTGIVLSFFSFFLLFKVYYFPVASTVHNHPSRQSAISPKQSNEQSRFISECLQIQQQYANKTAYLTFDDGPNKYTTQILDILRDKQMKATFFVIGSRVSHQPHVIKQLIEDGHFLGLHSMSHNADKLYTSDPSSLITEMQQAHDVVLAETGVDTSLVRVPYGSMPFLKQQHRDALAASHFKLWDWTIDTYDWKQKNDPAAVVRNVMKQVTDEEEIILMHDSAVTVRALPQIIEFLEQKGYNMMPYSPYHHIAVNFWEDTRL